MAGMRGCHKSLLAAGVYSASHIVSSHFKSSCKEKCAPEKVIAANASAAARLTKRVLVVTDVRAPF